MLLQLTTSMKMSRVTEIQEEGRCQQIIAHLDNQW